MSEEEACWDAVKRSRPTGTSPARGGCRPTTRLRPRAALLRRTRLRGGRAAVRLVRRYQSQSPLTLRRLGALRRPARDDLREVHGPSAGQGDTRRRPAAIDRRRRLRPRARSGLGRHAGAAAAAAAPADHGLQMLAAYVGQMAPSGRITIAGALQAADEMRRVHRLAYRMALLRRCARISAAGKQLWQADPALAAAARADRAAARDLRLGRGVRGAQPRRQAGARPIFLGDVATQARARGDYLLGEIFFSLGEDGAWHRAAAQALVRAGSVADAGDRDRLAAWAGARAPRRSAVAPLARELGGGAEASFRPNSSNSRSGRPRTASRTWRTRRRSALDVAQRRTVHVLQPDLARFHRASLEEEMGRRLGRGLHFEDFQRCMDTYVDAFNDAAGVRDGIPPAAPRRRLPLDPRPRDAPLHARRHIRRLHRLVRRHHRAQAAGGRAAQGGKVRDEFLSIASHELRRRSTSLKLRAERLHRARRARRRRLR